VLRPAVAGGAGVDPGIAEALEGLARRRAGETLACGPLIALALARAGEVPPPAPVVTAGH
jgi:hypothetical protein